VAFLFNYIKNIYEWKKPIHTVVFSISVTYFLYNPGLCLAIAFITFYIFSDKIISKALRLNKKEEKFLDNLSDFKKNLYFL
jgi:hypothetical protein